MNDPRVTPTEFQLLVSDSVEFAQMVERVRKLLFTIDLIQKRNLKDCREMFGTDFLEKEGNQYAYSERNGRGTSAKRTK